MSRRPGLFRTGLSLSEKLPPATPEEIRQAKTWSRVSWAGFAVFCAGILVASESGVFASFFFIGGGLAMMISEAERRRLKTTARYVGMPGFGPGDAGGERGGRSLRPKPQTGIGPDENRQGGEPLRGKDG